MGEDIFFIMDLKKLNWNLDEYITYKPVSIYLFVGSLTQNMSNLFSADVTIKGANKYKTQSQIGSK